MDDSRTCLHCGSTFPRPSGPGRPRRWCFDCLPRHEAGNQEYFRKAYALSLFAKTGKHGGCCGIRPARPREPTKQRLVYGVYPSACLYCDEPLSQAAGRRAMACPEHSAHHHRTMARLHRQSPQGRAKRNAAKTARRNDKRLLTIVRIIERDGTRCALCGFPCQIDGDDPTTIDHTVPISKGGSNDLPNLQLAHRSCNISKGAKLLETG